MRLLRALIPACALVLSGCGAADPPGQPPHTSENTNQNQTAGQPQLRMISLAPHLTELAFAAGAGGTLVGVVEYSDYPVAAKSLPRIGDAFRIDIERVMALNPDLVLAWSSGNSKQMVELLAAQGIPVTTLEPVHLEQIAEQIEFIGHLAGTEEQARISAIEFRNRLASLERDFAARDNISVFYQISSQPLYTINKDQIINEAIAFCGGSNIFADLDDLAPVVGLEAVVSRDPAAMIAPQIADEDPLARWRSFVTMTAVRSNNLYTVDADLVARATPRLLDGVRQICEALDSARAKYPRKKE